MIAILSPARNVKPCAVPDTIQPTRHAFMPETLQLVQELRALAPWQLESILDVPDERAMKLYEAYQFFDESLPGLPAILAYNGQAYRNLRPAEFTKEELYFADGHLRIFSALYGMLRPLDGVLDHRLGLKKAFSPNGADLHKFWGDKLYKNLFAGGDVVVNLASLEYAKLVVPHMQPGDEMVTCRFLVDKPGGPKGTVSTVRAARGLMARFIVENRVEEPEALKGFDAEGYRFIPSRSSGREYVFVKPKRGGLV